MSNSATNQETCALGFEALDLDPELIAVLQTLGYTEPTPIQRDAIPHALEARDLLACAQTGTGKTAAFALPILDELLQIESDGRRRPIRALVLAPTRELAAQIAESFRSYTPRGRIRCEVVFGGIGKRPQVTALRRGVDVLIATPGRLLDLMGDGEADLSQVEMFVLDEADRMLDMGFIPDVRRIVARLPKQRQTLLFSATMPDAVAELAAGLLADFERIEAAPPATTVERVEQRVLLVEKADKRGLLAALFRDQALSRALVFARTKHGADRVAKHLRAAGVSADAIHGDKAQGARQRALDAFKAGRLRALVATDIAARGIDVEGVSHVVNFDLPNEPESYVHRIGRTARAGRGGTALSFCDADEVAYLRAIEKAIRRPVPVEAAHPYHSAPVARVHAAAATSARRPGGQARRSAPRRRGRGPGRDQGRSRAA